MIIKENIYINHEDIKAFFLYEANISYSFVFETIGINNIDITTELKKNGKLRYRIIITTDNDEDVFVISNGIPKKHYKKVKRFFEILNSYNSVKDYFENDLLVVLEEDRDDKKDKDKNKILSAVDNENLENEIDNIFESLPTPNIFSDLKENIYPIKLENITWERITEKNIESNSYKLKRLYYSG